MWEALEAADPEAQTDWVDYFRYGLLDSRREWDKEGFLWPAPIASTLRQEIDRYLAARGDHRGVALPGQTRSFEVPDA